MTLLGCLGIAIPVGLAVLWLALGDIIMSRFTPDWDRESINTD